MSGLPSPSSSAENTAGWALFEVDECDVWSDRLAMQHKAFIALQHDKLPEVIQSKMHECTFKIISSYKAALSLPILTFDKFLEVGQWQTQKQLRDIHNQFVSLKSRIKGLQVRWSGLGCRRGNKLNLGASSIIDSYDNGVKAMRHTAQFFLHNLDDTKHTDEDVKLVIKIFPQASRTELYGYLPIQKAATDVRSARFVACFANEGDLELPMKFPQNQDNIGKISAEPTKELARSNGRTLATSDSRSPSHQKITIRKWLTCSKAKHYEDLVRYDRKYLEAIKLLEAKNLFFTADKSTSIFNKCYGNVDKDDKGCRLRIRYILEVCRSFKSPNVSDIALSIHNRIPGKKKRRIHHQQKTKSVTPLTSRSERSWKKAKVSLPRSVLNSSTDYERHLAFEFGREVTANPVKASSRNSIKQYMKIKSKDKMKRKQNGVSSR